jgi:nucleotide-binding universal stress UspA family protein
MVAVDGSNYSDKAVDYAIDLAKRFSARLTIIHVIKTPITFKRDMWDSQLMADLLDHFGKDGHSLLSSTLSKAIKAGIQSSTKLLQGNPADEIIKIAEDEAYDLIVLGSRGLGSVGRILLGSVSDNVSRHATCPILIIK